MIMSSQQLFWDNLYDWEIQIFVSNDDMTDDWYLQAFKCGFSIFFLDADG